MPIVKPDWLRSALESGWLNFTKGQWWEFAFVSLPPFDFTPGLWIETALDWVITFIDNALSLGKTAWDWAVDAFYTAKEALGKITGWLQNAATLIGTTIVDWWKGVLPTLQDWFWSTYDFLFRKASDAWDWILNANKWVQERMDEYLPSWFLPFREQSKFWDAYGDKAVSFFSNPTEWFKAHLAVWLLSAFLNLLVVATWPLWKAFETYLTLMWDEEE